MNLYTRFSVEDSESMGEERHEAWDITETVLPARPQERLLCPARESSRYLCDRVAEYLINGTLWCNIHARRQGDTT